MDNYRYGSAKYLDIRNKELGVTWSARGVEQVNRDERIILDKEGR